MEYKSKPHTIWAFRFTGRSVKPPKWFLEAAERRDVYVTFPDHRDDSNGYITIYVNKDEMRRAYVGDWICMNKSETIFPLKHEEMERGFFINED